MAYEVPEVPNFNETAEKATFDKHVKMLVASFVLSKKEETYSRHFNHICCGASPDKDGVLRGFCSTYTCGIGCKSDMDYCREAHARNPAIYPNIDEWFSPTENEIDTAIREVSAKGYRIEWRYNSQGRAGHLGLIR
jgi:hypothetical protein